MPERKIKSIYQSDIIHNIRRFAAMNLVDIRIVFRVFLWNDLKLFEIMKDSSWMFHYTNIVVTSS